MPKADNVVDRLGAWRMQLADKPAATLRGGDGGGTFDGMEPRVAALEAHISHIQSDMADVKGDVRAIHADLSAIKVDVATLKERTPTKAFIVQALVGGMVLFGAIIAFADQLKKLLGLH